MNQLTVIQPAQVPSFSMSDMERIALAIARGGLFGSTDQYAVLTLCLVAQAEGKHPAQVMIDYDLIKGKPAKKAQAMLRDFLSAGGRVEWHALTDEIADATFSHPAGGTVRIDWTLDRARTAGLTTDMWRKYPRQMLRSRVISEGVRAIYPGATSGLYEVGEVEDIVAEKSNSAVQTPNGGFVEGQIEHRAVSPSEPANYTPEEQADKPAKGWREPDSIYSTPTKLHAALASLERELHGVGDTETLDCLMLTDEWREFVRISELRAPHYLYGGSPAPEEFVGLLTKAQRLRDEFNLAEASGVADFVEAEEA